MIALLLALLLLVPAAVHAELPMAPTLGAELAPAPAGAEPTALAIPAQVTICIDRAARRCWTVAGATGCGNAAGIATVAADSPEAGARLRACWDALK